MKEDLENYKRVVLEFGKIPRSRELIIRSFKEIIPNKQNWVGPMISLVFAAYLSFEFGFSDNTITSLDDVVNDLLNVQLALLGCIFTVYSIILAFLSKSYMQLLAKYQDSESNSMLMKELSYYESILFLYFINIAITGIIVLFNPTFPERITDNIFFDNMLATALLLLYFWFSFRLFYEIKSVIYNTIALFRTSVANSFIDYCRENEKK